MTTRTRADLVIQMLKSLINLPEGQAPEIEDTARVDENLPSLMEQLAASEIIYIPDLDHIPEAWFLSLAKVAAYEMRTTFGVTGDQEVTMKNAYDEGVNALRVMKRGRPTYEPLKTCSF